MKTSFSTTVVLAASLLVRHAVGFGVSRPVHSLSSTRLASSAEDTPSASAVASSIAVAPAAVASAVASSIAVAPAAAAPAAAAAAPAAAAPAAAGDAAAPAAPPAAKAKPVDEPSKQHLYGKAMHDAENANSATMSIPVGEAEKPLPLPPTYITCGRCKSLFAIAEGDLGTSGKGCRVKCTVCGNNWYQSRDRLYPIPSETHQLLPAAKSNLDRVARNMARNRAAREAAGPDAEGAPYISPDFMGVFKLYVGNLEFGTKEPDLLEVFESVVGVGDICDVTVVRNFDGRSRGFAFVSFYNDDDGRKALELNGVELKGRELAVKEPNNNWENKRT